MDPTSNNGKTLPLTLYEERTHVVGDHTTSEFVRAEYTVQADEAERITVTHCAKVVNQEETGSAGQWTCLPDLLRLPLPEPHLWRRRAASTVGFRERLHCISRLMLA
jgi:hypothetical protein